MIRPRKAVAKLESYEAPPEGRAAMLRLDLNENTVGCPPAVARALRRAMQSGWLTRYPEYGEAREILARHFRVSPDELLITNGVDDAIKLICDTFVEPGDVLVIPDPTFPMYRFFQQVAGGEVRRISYDESFRLPMDKLIASAGLRARWVALANPNNPTGTLFSKRDLKALLEAAPETLVLVDEAYFDFSGMTILPWIRRYPNLIVTRTFSKAYGLAALRIGFLLARKELTDAMRKCQAVYAVNSAAVCAATEAIRHLDQVQRYSRMIVEERRRFCQQLDRLGIRYAPTFANFVLARFGTRADEIARRLRESGILVRGWSEDRTLKEYLRISIGTPAQMGRLVEALYRLRPLMETGNVAQIAERPAASTPKRSLA